MEIIDAKSPNTWAELSWWLFILHLMLNVDSKW
jgi:hypothetical protein